MKVIKFITFISIGFVCLIGFQNCTRATSNPVDEALSSTSIKLEMGGNGQGYEGKPLPYYFSRHADCQGDQDNKALVHREIHFKEGQYWLVRDNCIAISPRLLNRDEINFATPNQSILAVNGALLEGSQRESPPILEKRSEKDTFLVGVCRDESTKTSTGQAYSALVFSRINLSTRREILKIGVVRSLSRASLEKKWTITDGFHFRFFQRDEPTTSLRVLYVDRNRDGIQDDPSRVLLTISDAAFQDQGEFQGRLQINDVKMTADVNVDCYWSKPY